MRRYRRIYTKYIFMCSLQAYFYSFVGFSVRAGVNFYVRQVLLASRALLCVELLRWAAKTSRFGRSVSLEYYSRRLTRVLALFAVVRDVS